MRKANTLSSNSISYNRTMNNNNNNGSYSNNNGNSQNSNHLLQVDNEFKCNIKDHQRERIDYICTYKDCTAESRLCCMYCKQLYHGSHQKEKVIKLKEFSSKVVVDAEKLTKRFEEMVEENDIKLIFQQRLQKTVKDKLNELVKSFQRSIKISRERISTIIESTQNIYEQAENQDICDDIHEFNNELYKILHRSYKLHSKEDIEILTKIYRNENYSEYLSNSKSISRNKFFYFANDRLDQYFSQLTIETDNLIRDLGGQIKKMEEIVAQSLGEQQNKNQGQTTKLPTIGRNSSETRFNQKNVPNYARPRSSDKNKSQILITDPSGYQNERSAPNKQYMLKREVLNPNNNSFNGRSLLNSMNQSNNNHYPVMQRNTKSYKTVKFDKNQIGNNGSKFNLNDCILLLDLENNNKKRGNNQRLSQSNLNDSLLSQDNHESNMPFSPFKDSNSKNNGSFSLLKDLMYVDNPPQNNTGSQIKNQDSNQKQNGSNVKEATSPESQIAYNNQKQEADKKQQGESATKAENNQKENQQLNQQGSLPVYKIRDIQKENQERNKPKEEWIQINEEEVPDIKSLTEAADKQIGEFQYILPTDHTDSEYSTLPVMKNTTNGQIYSGQWKDGQRHGKGLGILKDGSVYVGYWKNNQANGYGRIIHPNGNIYEGDWMNGKAHGRGIYRYPNGTKYEGEWFEDLYDGYGVKTWNQGSVYQGYYRQGYRDGKGVFTWPDGSSYDGYFYKNQIHGYGIYKWKDGREYRGEWSSGKMNGKGWFKWPDDRIYEGNYFNDKKEGFGVFHWPNNEKTYEGYWLNDQPHGIGHIIQKNGQKSKGEWQDGKQIRWIPDSEDTSAQEKKLQLQFSKPGSTK
ncbi:MORN motif protein (macronuclear) [Tetrahymena thermophila SB210]|uniref:MORN motif protein n=1 Tax=Tetrahymena thermophila (strain SB210) TaxID=312017 RepID=Q24FW3_TETTS|nr:MORN motif protein [Tetrahymena thermophila SB210]EAS06647.2 MORN motif protein [Tetrahymena thermophila SB210]|eukprot:XP_001026892.2 MORN motif protein [Tetrahymena thermophila SB210]